MKKKIFLSLIVVILSLSLALCFVACKSKDPNKIRIVEVTHSVFYAPLYIAIEKEYLKDEGLDVELTNGGGSDKSMTAILSGQADMGLLGSEAVIYTATSLDTDRFFLDNRNQRCYAQMSYAAHTIIISNILYNNYFTCL